MLNGFKVSRPNILAVGSPSCKAIQPCAVSCTVIANKTGKTQTTTRCKRFSSSMFELYPDLLGITLTLTQQYRRIINQIDHRG